MDMYGSSYSDMMVEIVEEMMAALAVLGIYVGGLLIIMLVGIYAFNGYRIMQTGKKAGLSKDWDWMPYVPVARQIYQMNIADCPWWYIFFFGFTLITTVPLQLVLYVLSAVFGNPVVELIIQLLFWIVCLVFTWLYYRKFYPKFNFDKNTAWLHVIPGFSIGLVFEMVIAFYNKITFSQDGTFDDGPRPGSATPPKLSQKEGIVSGIAGKYAGYTFSVQHQQSISFGRNAAVVNIVFDDSDKDISRVHCKVEYDADTDQYTVTDYSSFGTYQANGIKLNKGESVNMPRGSVIYLGNSRKNGFKLG